VSSAPYVHRETLRRRRRIFLENSLKCLGNPDLFKIRTDDLFSFKVLRAFSVTSITEQILIWRSNSPSCGGWIPILL